MKNRKILKYVSLLVSLMVAACAPSVLADKDKENATTKNEESGSTSTQNRKQTEVLEEQNSKQQTKEKQKLEKNKKEKEKKPENKKNKDQKKKKKTKKEETEIKKEEKKEESEVKKDKEKKKEVEIKKNKEEKEDVKDLTKKKEKNLEKEPEKKDLKEKNELKGEPKEGEKKEEKVVEFNKKDYEVDGFNLDVIEKNGCHILDYTHKKLKSHVIVTLVKDEKNLKNNLRLTKHTLKFRIPAVDDSGVNHMCEHLLVPLKELCVKMQKLGKQIGKDFNVFTGQTGIEFAVTGDEKNVLEFYGEIFKELKKAKLLKDNGDLFKHEIHDVMELDGKKYDFGRVYFELFNLEENVRQEGVSVLDIDRNDRIFSTMGGLKNIKNARLEDVKKVYQKYFHPSNAIFTVASRYNPENVKAYLNIYDSWCSSFEEAKKFEAKDVQPRFKNEAEFLEKEISPGNEIFCYNGKVGSDEYGIKESKYCAEVMVFYDRNMKAEEKDVFKLFEDNSVFELIDKEKLNKMGYKNCCHKVIENLPLFKGNVVVLILHGDEKESFTYPKLKENCEEIMRKFVEKIKNMPSFERNKYYDIPKSVHYKNIRPIKKTPENDEFKKENLYRGRNSLDSLIFNSFIYFDKPFSDKFFDIKNGKILDSRERLFKNVEKNLDKLDWLYKAFSKKGYTFFNVFKNNGLNYLDEYKKENGYENLSDEDFRIRNNVEIYFDMPTKDLYLNRFATRVFTELFFNIELRYKGILYKNFIEPLGYRLPIIADMPKNNRELFKKYLKSNFFKKDLKKFEISQEDFEFQKENFKKDCAKLKEDYEKILENFEKARKQNKNRLDKLSIDEFSNFDFSVAVLCDFIISKFNLIKNEKEFKQFVEFINKRQKAVNGFNDALIKFRKDEKVKAKEFKKLKKEFLKYCDYFYKKFKKIGERIEKLNDFANDEIDNLSLEEFLKIIKSTKITDFKEGSDCKFAKKLYIFII